jgi:hypothetical protein
MYYFSEESEQHFPLEIPEKINNWLEESKTDVSLNIIHSGDKIHLPQNQDVRMDVLPGATFAQVKILQALLIDVEIWATSAIGTESIRIDEEGSIPFASLDPVESLILCGQDASFKEVVSSGFDLTILEPYIKNSFNCARIDHNKLKRDFKLDPMGEKILLEDESGKCLSLDSQDREGFWLEDVVMENLSKKAELEGNTLYRNYMINREDLEDQFLSGLSRITDTHINRIIPRQRLFIAESLGVDPWRYSMESDEFKAVVKEINFDMFKDIPYTTYQDILEAGSVNEFDALLIKDNEIITIEVKATKPRLFMLAKLTTLISRHLTPLKKKGMLIHAYQPKSNSVGYFNNQLELWEKLFPDIEVVSWFDLIGLNPPKSANNNYNPNWKRKSTAKQPIEDSSKEKEEITQINLDIEALREEQLLHNKVLRWLTFMHPNLLLAFHGVKKIKGKWHIEANKNKAGHIIGKNGLTINGLSEAIPELNRPRVIERGNLQK